MESSGAEDDFFGDQSSEPDSVICDEAPPSVSGAFGNLADQDYRSHESSIKTLAYVDGYDETKEERLQNGFSEGYKQAFGDAFGIGCRMGSMFAKVALSESLTLGVQTNDESNEQLRVRDGAQSAAVLIRQFLTNEFLTENSQSGVENSDDEAVLKLEHEFEKLLRK